MPTGSVTVVNKYKHQGPSIYIGRGSVFGNPFGISMGRAECIEKYRKCVFEPKMNNPRSEYRLALLALVERVKKGEHIYLQCFCAPQACHGDILKQYIESQI